MLAVELHVHSDHSHDGRDPVDLILQQAAAVGLDAVAITDHDEIEGSLEALELAREHEDLLAIPGMEVSSGEGHVLAIGVKELIPPGMPFEVTVERIRDQGGLAIIPHPFQESRHGVAKWLSREEMARADAIEVYNSRLITGHANNQARRFARAHELPMTAGSDAHISEMVGQAVTHVDARDRSVEAIVDAIAAGRTIVDGKRTPWHISFRQAAGGASRRLLRRLRGDRA